MSLAGHFTDIEGQVLVYQTEKYQLMNKFAPEAVPFGITEPPCFCASVWTLYGLWGSGDSAPDESVQDFMPALGTCKFEEVAIKIEGDMPRTRSNMYFLSLKDK